MRRDTRRRLAILWLVLVGSGLVTTAVFSVAGQIVLLGVAAAVVIVMTATAIVALVDP